MVVFFYSRFNMKTFSYLFSVLLQVVWAKRQRPAAGEDTRYGSWHGRLNVLFRAWVAAATQYFSHLFLTTTPLAHFIIIIIIMSSVVNVSFAPRKTTIIHRVARSTTRFRGNIYHCITK